MIIKKKTTETNVIKLGRLKENIKEIKGGKGNYQTKKFTILTNRRRVTLYEILLNEIKHNMKILV